MRSKFAKSINPWTQQRMTKNNNPRKPDAQTSVEEITFTDDKPVQRSMPVGKYAAVFEHAYKTGQRIKCPSQSIQAIGNGARKWVEKHGHAAKVSAISRYPTDGMGGVWVLAEQKQ